jgi:hypothetical protein
MMGWVSKIFGAVPKEEMEGIHLDTTQPYWEIKGPRSFMELFQALQGWIPEDAVLYFEGGSPDAVINEFMGKHSIPEQVHIAIGTIWPRPKIFHVPATTSALVELSRIMEHHADPELAVHFHVYQDGFVLLEWHDPFFQPILISNAISQERVAHLAQKMGTTFRKIGEPDGAANRP